MLRLFRSRPLALLAGLWFLVAGREPPFPHPCEMGGTAAVAAAADEPSHHEHAQHGHEASGQEQAPSECDCVDDCCVSVVVQGSGGVDVAGAGLVPRAESRIAAVAARATDAATRLLPFANGPPELT